MNRTFIFDNSTVSTVRKGLFYLFLLFPLAVAALPNLVTHYEEDALLLGLFFYLILRMLNPNRLQFSLPLQRLFFILSAGMVYSILWLGLVRGYQESYCRWLILFPASLVSAAIFHPASMQPDTKIDRILRLGFGGLMVIVFGIILIRILGFHDESARVWLSRLFVFPILYCLLWISRKGFPLEKGIDHLPWVILFGLIAYPVWYKNAVTWWLWYQAGAVERSWTPFKEDRPKEIQEAEKKPYEAVQLYSLVSQRIADKGFLPRRLNWQFFMHYRMAIQAMRKQDAVTCTRLLPPSQVNSPDKIRLLKELWHNEFLWGMQRGEPNLSDKDRIWVDLAMNPDRSAAYALDRWGRVYSFVQGELWREWEPATEFNDAMDLEIFHDVFVVLRSNGSLISSKPIPAVPTSLPVAPPGQNWIRIKKFHSTDGMVAVTNYGETAFLGDLPENFRALFPLVFSTPAVADLEIDPDEGGYYLLDIFGAVHAVHPVGMPSIPCTSPPLPKALVPYWDQIPTAIDLEVDPLKRSLSIYTCEGEVYCLAVTPYQETYRPPRKYPHRGTALGAAADGAIWALESNGKLVKIP